MSLEPKLLRVGEIDLVEKDALSVLSPLSGEDETSKKHSNENMPIIIGTRSVEKTEKAMRGHSAFFPIFDGHLSVRFV
jgi:hypothetical protein